jgi:hypothetical protein
MNSVYGDLLLRTEIRWFSRGTCLIRFHELRSEVRDLLSEHVPNPIELKNQLENADFLRNLAFLTDITQHLNVLNLQFQGKSRQFVKWSAALIVFVKATDI